MSIPVNCLSVPLLLFLPLHHPRKTMAPTHPFTCPPSKTFAIISHQQIQLDEPCSFGGWGTDISILSGLFVSSWKLFQSSLSTDRQVTNGYVMFLVDRNTVSVLSGLVFSKMFTQPMRLEDRSSASLWSTGQICLLSRWQCLPPGQCLHRFSWILYSILDWGS